MGSTKRIKEICGQQIIDSCGLLDVPSQVDVLIVTALRLELEAFLNAGRNQELKKKTERGDAKSHQHPITPLGLWTEYKDASHLPFYVREYDHYTGMSFRVAVAECIEMGKISATARALSLVRELTPRCIGMTGICAGRRGKVNLGDVIVSDRLFEIDAGKIQGSLHKGGQLQVDGDIATYSIDTRWKFALEEFCEKNLTQFIDEPQPLGNELAVRQIVEKLKNKKLHIRDVSAIADDWQQTKTYLRPYVEFVKGDDDHLELSEEGEAFYKEVLYDFPGGVHKPDFKAHICPLATVSQVMKVDGIFEQFDRVERKTCGLDMETASLGFIAYSERIPWMIVAKGVADFGDTKKDDSFQRYAASASAGVVLGFLTNHLPPRTTEIIPAGESTTLDAKLQRTHRINKALSEAQDRGEKQIRIVAAMSALGISDNEGRSSAEYEEALIEERDYLISLLKGGCKIKCILNPGFFKGRSNNRANNEKRRTRWLNRHKQLLEILAAADQNGWDLSILKMDLYKYNLLIIGKTLMFEGRKIDGGSGFQKTIASTDPNQIAFEISYFDELFDKGIEKGLKASKTGAEIDWAKKSRQTFREVLEKNMAKQNPA